MATVRPGRTAWIAPADGWCYFDAVAGDFIEHDSQTLVVASDNTNAPDAPSELYRFAIRFDATAGPSWISEGPIVSSQNGLLAVIMQIAARSGGFFNRLQRAVIQDPWTSASTAAEMRALTISAWSTVPIENDTLFQRLNLFPTGTVPFAGSYGYMFRVNPDGVSNGGGCMRVNAMPTPHLFAFYRYSPTTTISATATERATLSADALAVLDSKAVPAHYRTDATILPSEQYPAQSDTSLTIVSDTDLGIKSRAMNWPESWVMDIPAAGAIPISLVSDTIRESMRGATVESELTMVMRDGTEHSIGKQWQLVGDIIMNNDGTGEIELRSPIESIMGAIMADASPYGAQTVNYDDEFAAYILIDAMLNSGKLLFRRTHYNDIVHLLQRFAGVFGGLTYSVADLRDKTVGELVSEIGPMYGFCVSQAGDGCVDIWHPAVYRPSRRVWTIDEGDCQPGGYSVVYRGADGQYDAVTVFDDIDTNVEIVDIGYSPGARARDHRKGSLVVYSIGSSAVTVYPSHAMRTDMQATERVYQVRLPGDIFHDCTSGSVTDNSEAKHAAGRQLLQRLAGKYYECNLQLGLKGLPIDPGDVIKLTGPGLPAETPFLVTATSGSGADITVHGYHYPNALGLTSTFEDTGIEGEWRWANQDGTLLDENTAPGGSDPDPTTCTLADPTARHWQGPVHATGYAEWGSALINAAKYDYIEVCTMLLPEIDGAIRQANWSPAGGIGGDDLHMPIFGFAKTGTTEAVFVGFYRPGFDTATDDIVTHRLFVGWTDDYTVAGSGPMTFNAYIQSANGVAGRSDARPISETPCALSLSWAADGVVRLFADRQLVCAGTGFTKTGWTSLHVMTQPDIRIGHVRHIQTDTEITNLQRLQGANGVDPYCP